MEMEEGNIRGQGQPRQRARTTTMAQRSDMYEHFTDVHGDKKVWRCKHCHKDVRANVEKGTSNLRKHFNKYCSGRDMGGESHPTSSSLPQPMPQLQLPGPGEPSDREPAAAGPEEDEAMPLLQPSGPGEPAGPEEVDEASRDLARMIALHGYDPSVVEDDYFRSFVRRLNPEFELPSREAIEKMCSDIFQDSRRDLYCFGEDDPGKVSVAVGQSETIEPGQVVYATTIHFIDHNWNLHREVEDVRMALPVGDHYHVPLRQVPVVSLDDVFDDTVFRIQWGWWFHQKGLFMIAGETTGHINHLKLKDRIQEKNRLVKNIIYSATHMDHVLHSIARCLLPDSEFAKNIFNTIQGVRNKLLFEQAEILTKLGLAKLGLLDDPWEYDERWYSCYCCLEIVVQTLSPDSDDEEYSVKLMRALWRVIYRAIKGVSDSSRPTSNLCLQELFNVREILKSQLSKAPPEWYLPDINTGFGNKSVANVLSEVIETVDKAIQDSYLVWSIPLVLDPRHKLRSIKSYFKKAFGLSEAAKYVSEIRRETKELYTSYIEDDDGDSEGIDEDMAVDSSNNPSEQVWDEQCRSQDGGHAEAENELDNYLQDSLARETEGFDILNWWKDHGSVQYPTVARMAKDALAMPTCSKLTSNQIGQVKSMLRGYHR